MTMTRSRSSLLETTSERGTQDRLEAECHWLVFILHLNYVKSDSYTQILNKVSSCSPRPTLKVSTVQTKPAKHPFPQTYICHVTVLIRGHSFHSCSSCKCQRVFPSKITDLLHAHYYPDINADDYSKK